MKWLLWAGIAFVIGGTISLGITIGATGKLHFLEDTTSYSVGWVFIGLVLIVFSYLQRAKKENL